MFLTYSISLDGCQMNVSDSDIIRSILLNHNRDYNGSDQKNHIINKVLFDETTDEMDADVLLVSTMFM